MRSSTLRLDPFYEPWFERFTTIPQEDFENGDSETTVLFDSFLQAGRGARHADVQIAESTVQGPHGSFRVRVYTPPTGTGPWHALVWMHGGAWFAGSLDMPEGDGVSREVCARGSVVVVSVDYHLVNSEVCWPVPHDDCMAALYWTVEHHAELGIVLDRIAVGGASAGANLAAGVALRARDEGSPRISSLQLIYPVLYLDPPPQSVELREALDILAPLLGYRSDSTGSKSRALWSNFLGPSITHPSPYAVPALANLAGLPPTLVVACEFDRLRPHAEQFVAQLRAAGVPTTARIERGVLHGHLNLLGRVAKADETIDAIVAVLESKA